ncbi:MAG TPA: glyoxalase [Leptospiraceae bacterium]|nr:glyoxalase [Spirochaetaceae bacterium]HBS04380.1 glyoxalase [Leptospiraceae bacterium]|tara:strand:+ start:20075 stop:20509 length:435 start_codon:yes stop_codon:yes gene_type:complete
MHVKRLDNVGVVVQDLSGAVSFFEALGLELEGQTMVHGEWVDLTIGLEDARVNVAMLRTPDSQCRIELMQFLHPTLESSNDEAPPNACGLRRIMFAVHDIEATVSTLQKQGARLMGEIVKYESSYKLCYIRGPEGLIVALAQEL